MTIRHLRIFLTVCQENSVTRAAAKLYMSQPAVSLAIKELEIYYGVKLFDRISKTLQITPRGRELLEYALNIVKLFDHMEQAMKNQDFAGEIRIGSSLTIGACLLPHYTKALKECFPHIQPKIRVDKSENIISAVLEGSLDMGIIEGKVSRENFFVIPFMEDWLVPICSKNSRLIEKREITLDDFLEEPLLLREEGSAVRELFESVMEFYDKKIEPQWESASTTALIRAVEAGNGVSVLPERLVEDYLSSERIAKPVLNIPMLKRSFNLFYHRKKYLSNSMLKLIDIVKEPMI